MYFYTNQNPDAAANIKGNSLFPDILGTAYFYQTRSGTVVATEVSGLPLQEGNCKGNIFAYHIHQGGSCGGDDFPETLGHYNPQDCPHPYHAGDMPPLFGAGGTAFSVFLTDRFTTDEIVGKTVVIHSKPDDFTSQPAGNAGEKIACGVIERY